MHIHMHSCMYICVCLFVLCMYVFEYECMDACNDSHEIVCIGIQYFCICKFIEILYLQKISRIGFVANICILTYTSTLCNDLCFKQYV